MAPEKQKPVSGKTGSKKTFSFAARNTSEDSPNVVDLQAARPAAPRGDGAPGAGRRASERLPRR